jgi:hypothetical protein
MAKRLKTWTRGPAKPPTVKVPDAVKGEVSSKAQKLIDEHLKPTHVKPPPKKADFNYLTDLSAKWRGTRFYFCATYASPGPFALSPMFEIRFARMGYLGSGRFSLAYMRHNDQWNEIYPSLSLDECLSAIRDEPHFIP